MHVAADAWGGMAWMFRSGSLRHGYNHGEACGSEGQGQ